MVWLMLDPSRIRSVDNGWPSGNFPAYLLNCWNCTGHGFFSQVRRQDMHAKWFPFDCNL